MERETFEILRNHYGLLSPRKQAVARWLCEDWNLGEKLAPGWLRHKYWDLFSFPLHEAAAPEKMTRELVLELLTAHKSQVLSRGRDAD